jgi:hypothetical protein
MLEALRDRSRNGWRPVALEINYEDGELYCCHSGKPADTRPTGFNAA